MGKQYELYVQKGQPFWKVITNILFSHVGLLVLVIGYSVAGNGNIQVLSLSTCFFSGALAFMWLEADVEQANYDDKVLATEVTAFPIFSLVVIRLT